MDSKYVLPSLCKKRNHVKGLITKQANRLRELERMEASPEVAKLASDLLKKMQGLNADFKTFHFEILECIDVADEASLGNEQEAFNTHDERMESFYPQIDKLVTCAESTEYSSLLLGITRTSLYKKGNVGLVL